MILMIQNRDKTAFYQTGELRVPTGILRIIYLAQGRVSVPTF